MYIVVEFMITMDRTPGTLCYAFDTLDDAKAKYHTILAAAAVSTNRIHSAAILTQELMMIQSDYCVHEVE